MIYKTIIYNINNYKYIIFQSNYSSITKSSSSSKLFYLVKKMFLRNKSLCYYFIFLFSIFVNFLFFRASEIKIFVPFSSFLINFFYYLGCTFVVSFFSFTGSSILFVRVRVLLPFLIFYTIYYWSYWD